MLEEAEVVSKVLWSLALKFDFVAVGIEEAKEISKFTLDDLSGTLQAHDVRMNCTLVKLGEKALHVKTEFISTCHSKGGSSGSSWGNGKGRGRSFTHGRGRSSGG